jgi:hypothetical protein
VVEPAVTGRVFSRALPKLPDRRVLVMIDEAVDVEVQVIRSDRKLAPDLLLWRSQPATEAPPPPPPRPR